MRLGDKVILQNGVQLPLIGFGTYMLKNDAETERVISAAIQSGYRLIDTARIYENEMSVGRGVKNSGIKRDDILISTKIWNSEKGYDETLAAVESSLANLQTDYLDVCLIHWPVSEKSPQRQEENIASWKALEQCYKQGKIRAIGVSNFLERHLKELMNVAEIKPMINQIEVHPKFQQEELISFCKENEIVVEAWSPIIRGMAASVRLLNFFSQKYKKSPAQICLRWCLQKGVVPLPKAKSQTHMLENLDVFDFELTADDMNLIADLDDPLCHAPYELYDLREKY